MAEALAGLGSRPVLTSPLRRARETADALAARLGVGAEVVPEFGEVPTPAGIELLDRGSWLREFMTSRWDDAPPLVCEWRERLLATLSSLHGDTLVFTHLVAINAVVAAADGTSDVTAVRPGNCSVTVVDAQGPSLEVVERAAQAHAILL